MFKLVFFVPILDADRVKNHLFSQGAGTIGNYDCCSFETEGVGQFRPLAGSDPTIGEQGKIEKVKELKVEMICKDILIKNVIKELKHVHPYEEPAYEVYRMENL